MRVVQVIDSLNWGGAQKLLLTLAEALKNRSDLHLTIVSLDRPPRGVSLFAELADLGVPVHVFYARSLFNPRRFFQFYRWLKAEKPDVVHTHLTYANILGVLAARLAAIPSFSTLHNPRYSSANLGSPYRRLETLALRGRANRIIAVGATVQQAHQSRFPQSEIVVLPNAVPIPELLTARQRQDMHRSLVGPDAAPLLISVGRLIPPKGYADLLAAFQQVQERYPNAVLLIAGGGRLFDDLARQIDARNLTGHVRLLGFRNDVPLLMAVSDLYVSASHSEGLPVVILEAMAAGLPIVATAVGETPQVLVAGTGILVPAHQPEKLAAGILQLLTRPDNLKSYGLKARRHVAENYNAQQWANQLKAIYTDRLES